MCCLGFGISGKPPARRNTGKKATGRTMSNRCLADSTVCEEEPENCSKPEKRKGWFGTLMTGVFDPSRLQGTDPHLSPVSLRHTDVVPLLKIRAKRGTTNSNKKYWHEPSFLRNSACFLSGRLN